MNKETDYELALNLMSVPRLCGLLQADGHFTITYDKQRVLNPKIILTQSYERIAWLYGIKHWLTTLNIKANLPTSETLKTLIEKKRSINLTIDRANCQKLLFLISDIEESQKTCLLFDAKRNDFLVLKESLKVKQSENKSSLTKSKAVLLVDLKHSCLKRNQTKGLSRESLIERLGFPGIKTEGCANALILDIKQKCIDSGSRELEILLKNPNQIKPMLAEFIAGFFDGDGSFRIGLFTHVSEAKTKIRGRNTFEIVPLINVTSEIQVNDVLFKIINVAFGSGKNLRLINVNKQSEKISGSKGMRLEIKNVKLLKTYVIPFFRQYSLSIEKNQIRFRIFCKTVEAMPFNYKNQDTMILIIKAIYHTDLYTRNKTLEEFLEIVKLNYN